MGCKLSSNRTAQARRATAAATQPAAARITPPTPTPPQTNADTVRGQNAPPSGPYTPIITLSSIAVPTSQLEQVIAEDNTPQPPSPPPLVAEAAPVVPAEPPVVQTPTPPPPPPPPPSVPSCTICTTAVIEGAKDSPGLVQACWECDGLYCVDCLKSMFLTACKDESRMPPRCCTTIHLGTVAPYLTEAEIALYREKYEEWLTPNRTYCPIPTCSAFISARYLPPLAPPETEPSSSSSSKSIVVEATAPGAEDTVEIAGEASASKVQSATVPEVTFGTGVKMEVHSAPAMELSPSAHSNLSNASTVSCPKCETLICRSCKQVSHIGTPCDSPDAEILSIMRKWRIKQCPKCRIAIKRAYGCAHIACRCGAQWCWICQSPIGECPRDCEEDNEGEDEDPDTAGEYDDLDLGEEPNENLVGPWNCDHLWSVVPAHRLARIIPMECQRCWKLLGGPLPPGEKHDILSTIEPDDAPHECHCSAVICGGCVRAGEMMLA
ncbi:MAG: hypothetical protein M1829_006016 [Trizodia sp. TS-e1964]|nr:MAG: hypothetical protein M1829_006016 [Trizodia sp. TS-e1964]